jgi:hypothetical protein
MIAEIVSSEGQGVASVDSDRSSWEISLEKEIDQMISTGNIVALKKLTMKLKGFRTAVKLKTRNGYCAAEKCHLDGYPFELCTHPFTLATTHGHCSKF